MELVAEMMAKDPKKRPPSAAAVAQRLRAFASEEAIGEITQAVNTLVQEPREPKPHRIAAQSPHLEDTLTFEDDPLADLDGGGRSSQGTTPLAASSDETTPQQTPAYFAQVAAATRSEGDVEERDYESTGLSRLAMVSVAVAAVAVVGILGVLVWEAWG